MNPAGNSRHRILGALLVGPLYLLVLLIACLIHFKTVHTGITGWLTQSMKYSTAKDFAVQYGTQILLPFYFFAGLATWGLTLVPATLLAPDWWRRWRGREALAFGLSGMMWVHALLWWEVPTTLWVVPALRRLPFWLALGLLFALSLAYPLLWLRRQATLSLPRRVALAGVWLFSWSLLIWAPRLLPKFHVQSRGGSQPCQVLMLGIDGLRSDTFLAQAGQMQGIRYENAYTPIPATRLLWHILWGGDPLFYTVGHVGPSKEEFEKPQSLRLLQEAKDKGWRPRFYIDDGGTIGLAHRTTPLDDALSPAEGWENFVNSNLASSFPLYGLWENYFKAFPTTNPWAPMDGGLKEALRLGRGSGWVMFHSCLAHQPIFLSREELRTIEGWWKLSPSRYMPVTVRFLAPKSDVNAPDPRLNPARAYRIRMGSILRAWEPIWNSLAADPDYGKAARALFSDHGERFHNVGSNGFQLQGVHGYNLDPWECRVGMLLAGPGFSESVEVAPRQASVSLLGFRDGVANLLRGGTFDAKAFESFHPIAPLRYQTFSRDELTEEIAHYRQSKTEEIAATTFIAPGGLWWTEYGKSQEERAKDVSVGLAEGPDLKIWKPLAKGGAHYFLFRKYELQEVTEVDEEAYKKAKAGVETLFGNHPPVSSLPEVPHRGKK